MIFNKRLFGAREDNAGLHRPVPTDVRVVNAISNEVRIAATLVAVTTSTLNAVLAGRPLLPHLRAYVPADPVVFPNIRRRLFDGLDIGNWTSVNSFYRMLTRAKQETAGTLSSPGGVRSQVMQRSDLAKLTELWRATADAACHALVEADAHAPPLPPEAALSAKIDMLLAEVRDGHSPCVISGIPSIPACIGIRQYPRRVANIRAALCTSTEKTRVLVADISQGGCGLARAPSLEHAVCVTIVLDTGRALNGTVKWTDGSRMGVKLSTLLAPTDPLISAG